LHKNLVGRYLSDHFWYAADNQKKCMHAGHNQYQKNQVKK